jgi:hypothetical protein
MTAIEENPSPVVGEFAFLPQGETVVPGAEVTPPEATIVEAT